jgi:hypothetical protein
MKRADAAEPVAEPFHQMKARLVTTVVALTVFFATPPASAVAPAEAHRAAIVWLETNQNRDGSWGSGVTRPVATAEGLLALAKAGRPRSPAAQKAAAWLLTRAYAGVDHRARAVRALAAAGFSTAGLSNFGAVTATTQGWGPVAIDQGVTSYDSALVLAALAASGQAPSNTLVDLVVARRRGDDGWSGDYVPHSTAAPSDLTVTAEIVRALSQVNSSKVTASIDELNATVGPATSTLELAARLAALHAYGCPAACNPDALEAALLARMSSASWGSDPLVNALGLLAISTRPGRTLGGAPGADDDGDGRPNNADAFPQNPLERDDSDGDGIGNEADADDDGDGVCEGAVVVVGQCGFSNDVFGDNPREWADRDGDGTGNNSDTDADGDAVPDDAENAAGTNPLAPDTDGDGACDGPIVVVGFCTEPGDPCPTVASAENGDGDLFCSDRDECDQDPSDWRDTNDDGECDLADDDDDGDGWSDADELIAGTDPLDLSSTPDDLVATNPNGDFDRDGLTNAQEEIVYGTSPYLADTDQDGSTDFAEASLGIALNAAASPVPAPGVFGVFGAFERIASTHPAETNAAPIRATGTGGQPTPVALLGGSPMSAGQGWQNLAGYQPQCTVGRDLDGDGLSGLQEALRRTSFARVDTDEDGFADGAGGLVSTTGYTGSAWDLEPDGYLDGEDDHGTDAADPDDHPGKAGDVAPLGLPDGRITAGDATVEMQIVADPGRTGSLGGQRRLIADQAADADSSGTLDAVDVLKVLKEAGETP